MTALFYAAVHATRAHLLHRHRVRVAAHTDMRSLEAKHPELKRTKLHYDWLKQQSETARYYLGANLTWADVEKLRRAAENIENCWCSGIRKTLA